MQAAAGRGAEICVCASVRAHMLAAQGQGGHKVAALHCWHVVCVLKTHYCHKPAAYFFRHLRVAPRHCLVNGFAEVVKGLVLCKIHWFLATM